MLYRPINLGVSLNNWHGFVIAYGQLLGFTIDVWKESLAQYALAIMFVTTAAYCLLFNKIIESRASLYFIFIFIIPISLYLSNIHNIVSPRYMLTAYVMYLLLVSQVIEYGFQSKFPARIATTSLIVFLMVMNTICLDRFYTIGRGSSAEILHRISDSGQATYATNNEDILSATYFAHRDGLNLISIPKQDWCQIRPHWFLYQENDPVPPLKIIEGVAPCELTFTRVRTYSTWGLSGFQWVLYTSQDMQDDDSTLNQTGSAQ